MHPLKMGLELELAVDCCRARSDDERGDRDFDQIDWTVFLSLIRRHRIEGLAWRSLRPYVGQLPSTVTKKLSEAAAQLAQENLKIIAECSRIHRAFYQKGADILFVKGATLGELAYRDPFIKAGWDIDLLVKYETIEVAAEILDLAGYTLCIPPPDSRERICYFHRYHKESVWFNPTRRLYVDLHSELVDNPMLLSHFDPFQATQTVSLGGGLSLPTLGPDKLFAYLCVHGASSAWFRLKWIADLDALLGNAAEAEVRRLYERAKELGAGRAADLALALRSLLFRRALLSEVRDGLAKSVALRALVRMSVSSLFGRSPLLQPNEKKFGTIGIHLTQFLLMPGVRYLGTSLRRHVERRRLKAALHIA